MGVPFTSHGIPGVHGAALQLLSGGFYIPWEYNGWKQESMSWKNGCYIHAGLSTPFCQFVYRGPDVIEFCKRIIVNGFTKFPVGTAKHAVMCNDDGLIAAHGVLQRNAEDEVQLFGGGIWAMYQHSLATDLDVEQIILDNYLFQIAGPTSRKVLETACGESLEDLKFLHFRKTKVAGHEVEVTRLGMSGTLAYEFRGPMEGAEDVFNAVVEAGQDKGLERLGYRTYTVNHVEGGFPQSVWTFWPALDEGCMNFISQLPADTAPKVLISGSVDPANMRARLRTPMEVGWEKMIKFDHDFMGRAAIEAEANNPRRTIVTLEWDSDDVVDIYASLLRPGEEYKTLDLPCTPPLTQFSAHADHIIQGSKEIGYSSGTTYSYYYRKVISHATIDIDQAEIGNKVTILWGDHGKRMKEVTATVARFPYIDLPRNQDV